MSLTAYLGCGREELRMPEGRVDDLGVRMNGPVMTGEVSVEERRAMDAASVEAGVEARVQARDRRPERYRSVEDYDPVLRSHCRL